MAVMWLITLYLAVGGSALVLQGGLDPGSQFAKAGLIPDPHHQTDGSVFAEKFKNSKTTSLLEAGHKKKPHADVVMSLNDDNFDGLVGKDQGVFVVFCTLWCHYCQALEPAWLNLSTRFENDKDKVLIARLDITKRDDVKLVQRFNVIHFPTLLWFPTGQSKDPKGYTD
eukprot:529321_1